jgi:hypothetical protein
LRPTGPPSARRASRAVALLAIASARPAARSQGSFI